MGVGVRSAFEGSKELVEQHPTEFSRRVRFTLPLDWQLASETLNQIRRRHFRESYEGKLLTNALLYELQRPLARGLKPLPALLVRYLVGAQTADILGVTPGGWLQQWATSAAGSTTGRRWLGRKLIGGLPRLAASEISALLSHDLLQQFIEENADPASERFSVPAAIANSAGISAPQRRPQRSVAIATR
jgi:hypothetical protein